MGSLYAISVKNGSIPIVAGSKVLSGLILTVATDPPVDTTLNYMYIIESTGGVFLDAMPLYGSCPSGSRVSNQASPTQSTIGIVTTHKLQLTNIGNYTLTMAYTDTSGTPMSISPTFTFEVVGKPVTAAPVTAPTIDDTVDKPLRTGLSVGLTIALVFVGVVLFFLSYPLNIPTLTMSAILQDDNFLSNFFFVSALVSLAITVSLTLAWATNGGNGQVGLLGSPDWNLNPMAYHVIFMVSLVFTFQLFFYIFGPLLIKRDKSIYLDIFQVFAMIGAISGLYAAYIYENPPDSGVYRDSLTTMHSWIGIAALILIFGSFFWFTILRLTGDFGPPFVYRWMNFASWISTILPMMAIWLTLLAIGTGISDFLGQTTCVPVGQSPSVDYSKTSTPVYPYVPEGCKLGNGVGIASTFAACFTFLGVAYLVPMKVKKEPAIASTQVKSTKAQGVQSAQKPLLAPEYDYDEPTPVDLGTSIEGTTTMLVRRGLKASLDMNKRNSVDRSRASEYQTTRRSQEFIRGSIDSNHSSPRNRSGSVTKSLESVAATAHHNLTTIELRNKRPSSSRIIESSIMKNSPRAGAAAAKNIEYMTIAEPEEKGDWW